VRTEIITERSALGACAAEWNALVAESSAPSLFLTWEWIAAWLDTLGQVATGDSTGRDVEPLFVLVRDDDGRLTAVAPLHTKTMQLVGLVGYRCAQVLGAHDCGAANPDFIVRRGCEAQAMTAVLEALLEQPRWDCLWLPGVAEWTGALRRFRDTCVPAGLFWQERPREYAVLTLPATFDDYLATLSYNRRRHLRRETRRLMETPGIEFVRCESPAELPAMLAALFDLHGRWWQTRGESGTFARQPAKARFYERFAPVALANGWLRLYALKRDGVVVAVNYCYAYRGTIHGVQEGFDPAARDEGLGKLLQGMVIEAAIKEGLREFDFGGDYTEHKRSWHTELRLGHDLFVGRRTLKNRLLFTRSVWPTGRFLTATNSRPPGTPQVGVAAGA
jgi:CelD/BcsL family acetyltransferase involved in cellulose biosynthesis